MALPGYEDARYNVAEETAFKASSKVVGKSDPYLRFPKGKHVAESYQSTLTLAHPETRPAAVPQPADAPKSTRYQSTPANSNPFTAERPATAPRGLKKGGEPAVLPFKINEDVRDIKPILSRKPVEVAEPTVHVSRKGKGLGAVGRITESSQSEKRSVSPREKAAELRFKNSQRAVEENKVPVTHWSPEIRPSGIKLGVDQRYKYTSTNPQTLAGVLKPNKDNCEDRTAKVKPVPWACGGSYAA